jgi:hypothetical protein
MTAATMITMTGGSVRPSAKTSSNAAIGGANVVHLSGMTRWARATIPLFHTVVRGSASRFSTETPPRTRPRRGKRSGRAAYRPESEKC